MRCDVRSPTDRQTLVTAAIERFGRIDILVNNAGIAHSEPAETEPEERVRQLLETNLVSLYALTQLAARDMLARGAGVIVNVASPAAMISFDRTRWPAMARAKLGSSPSPANSQPSGVPAESESTRLPQASSLAPPAAGSTTPTKSPGSPHMPSSGAPRGPKNWTAHFSSLLATLRAISPARPFWSTEAGHAADRPETRLQGADWQAVDEARVKIISRSERHGDTKDDPGGRR